MHDHEIKLDALDAVERHMPKGKPVYMLNLIRYRETALYENGFDAAPCTGREAYHDRYIPLFRRIAAERLGSRVFLGAMLARLAGPTAERWDVVAVNVYADFATFRAIVDTDSYRREAEPHRLAALDGFGLFALDQTV